MIVDSWEKGQFLFTGNLEIANAFEGRSEIVYRSIFLVVTTLLLLFEIGLSEGEKFGLSEVEEFDLPFKLWKIVLNFTIFLFFEIDDIDVVILRIGNKNHNWVGHIEVRNL